MNNKQAKWMKLMWIGPLAILGIVVFTVLGGGIVMLLWNWLLPMLFGWPQIGFWQALGLLALCRILFGGFGMHGSQRRHSDRGFGDRIAERVAQRMSERCENMTPEERERVRERVRDRWGGDEPRRETTQL